MSAQRSSPDRRTQRGATLLEFLVALLVFAFGMLGTLGMQTKTLAASQISLYRSQAAALADDALDRLRADRLNAKAGKWDTPLAKTASEIDGTALADKELKGWKAEIESLLPSGQGEVSYKASGDVVITIAWNERGTPASFATVSAL